MDRRHFLNWRHKIFVMKFLAISNHFQSSLFFKQFDNKHNWNRWEIFNIFNVTQLSTAPTAFTHKIQILEEAGNKFLHSDLHRRRSLVSRDWLHDAIHQWPWKCAKAISSRQCRNNAAYTIQNAKCNMGHQKRVGINYGTSSRSHMKMEEGKKVVSKSFYAKLLLYSCSRTQPREQSIFIENEWGKKCIFAAQLA